MIRIVPMRRITQLVALLVALLVAGQSAMAEASCSMWLQSGNDHAPTCCMKAAGTSQPKLGVDCHGTMQSQSMASEWNRSGCQVAPVQFATAAMLKSNPAGRSTASVVIVQLPLSASPAITTHSFQGVPAPGPARYVLLQVFRI
jgi:hypothetical protein